MKIIRFFCLFGVLTQLYGCIFFHKDQTTDLQYVLLLGFQDASGNDLISGLEKSYYQNYKYVDGAIKKGEVNIVQISDCNYYEVGEGIYFNKLNGHFFIRFDCSQSSVFCDPPPKLFVNKVISPNIFGDEGLEHEIISYWEPDRKKSKNYKCLLIKYDNKEITDITYDLSLKASIATIIVDR